MFNVNYQLFLFSQDNGMEYGPIYFVIDGWHRNTFYFKVFFIATISMKESARIFWRPTHWPIFQMGVNNEYLIYIAWIKKFDRSTQWCWSDMKKETTARSTRVGGKCEAIQTQNRRKSEETDSECCRLVDCCHGFSSGNTCHCKCAEENVRKSYKKKKIKNRILYILFSDSHFLDFH